MIEISVLKLTRQAFAEFGDVIETDGAENFEINNGSTIRYHDLAKVETLGENASILVNIFRGDEKIFPLKMQKLTWLYLRMGKRTLISGENQIKLV